jgi:hypothetical protein
VPCRANAAGRSGGEEGVGPYWPLPLAFGLKKSSYGGQYTMVIRFNGWAEPEHEDRVRSLGWRHGVAGPSTGSRKEGRIAMQNQSQEPGIYGRLTGTADFGPMGKLNYENFSLLGIIMGVMAALQQAMGRNTPQSQYPGPSVPVSEPINTNVLLEGDPQAKLGWIAERLREIARKTPKHVQSRGVLFDIAALLRSAVSEMSGGTPTSVPADARSANSQSTSDSNIPRVTAEQLNWAFGHVQQQMPSDDPQLKSAFSFIRLALDDAAEGVRTAGSRQSRKERRAQRRQHQQQYS